MNFLTACRSTIPIVVLFLSAVLGGQNSHAAQSLSVDPVFNPPVFAAANTPGRILLLPDGKFVAFSNIDSVLDVATAGPIAVPKTGGIARFLANGSLDTSFHFPSDTFVVAAAALPDGRLIVAASSPPLPYGYGPGLSGISEVILRLNTDGSIDSSFVSAQTSGEEFDEAVRVITVQPDGKILVGGLFTKVNGTPRPAIVRLNSDGTVDTAFATLTMTSFFQGASAPGVWANPLVQPDGKILIGGDFDEVSDGTADVFCSGVVRLNANGTIDSSFQPSGFQREYQVRGIVMQSNGKIVIGGRFDGFPPHDFDQIPLIRLNVDGSADPSYACYDLGFRNFKSLVVQADDKVVGAADTVFRFNAADGNLDSTFQNPVLYNQGLTGPITQVFSLNLQSDGHILMGGLFTGAADPMDTTHFGIARVTTDGTLDSLTTVNKTALKTAVNGFTRNSDGSTLVTYANVDAAVPINLSRLLSNGSFDSTFNPFPSYDPNGSLTPTFSAVGLCRLPSEKVFVFGYRTYIDPYVGDLVEAGAYGRLFPDGTQDTSFGFDNTVAITDVFAQSDGKMLVTSDAPQFIVLGEQLQRIGTDGLRDPTFKLDHSVVDDMVIRTVQPPPPPPPHPPHSPPPPHPVVTHPLSKISVGCRVLTVLGNGKILFSYLAADNTYKLVRLNSDGSLDPTFVAGVVPATGTFFIYAFVSDPQDPTSVPEIPVLLNGDVPNVAPAIADAKELPGGTIVVVGSFTSYKGQSAPGIVELKSNGSVVPRPTFNPGAGAQWRQTPVTAIEHPGIEKVQVQSNGNMLVVGTFEAFNGILAPGIASLFPTGAVDTSFVAPVVRRKYGAGTTYLAKQSDGSYLLSGPFSRPGDQTTPSFIRLVPNP